VAPFALRHGAAMARPGSRRHAPLTAQESVRSQTRTRLRQSIVMRPALEMSERITIARNHFMVSGDRVNPLYINRIEQIHITLRNREAIPQSDDLL